MAHILEVVADGRPGGGTSNVLALIADIKTQSDHTVTFVTQRCSYALDRATSMGVKGYGLDFFPWRINVFIFLSIIRIVREIKPDIIHLHGGRACFYFIPLSWITSTPIIYTVRGYHFRNRPLLMKLLGAVAEWLCAHAASMVIFVSKQDELIALRWRFINHGTFRHVIYNGIQPQEMPVPKARCPRSLCFLGQLSQPKNPLFVLDVMSILRHKGFHLKIVGGGPMEPEVRKKINELNLTNVVHVTGVVGREKALEELNDASILIFPSLWEGFPLAPLEAMWLMIPVVSARLPCIEEIISNESSGILIPEYDPATYAEAIEKLASQTEEHLAMAKRARKTIEERFLRDSNILAHLNIYSSFLAYPVDADTH